MVFSVELIENEQSVLFIVGQDWINSRHSANDVLRGTAYSPAIESTLYNV